MSKVYFFLIYLSKFYRYFKKYNISYEQVLFFISIPDYFKILLILKYKHVTRLIGGNYDWYVGILVYWYIGECGVCDVGVGELVN